MVTPGPYYIRVQPSEVDTREEEMPSGIHVIRESVPHELVHRGVVLAVGPGMNDTWADFIEVADTIFYLKGIKLGGEEFVLAEWNNVIARERSE